MCCFHFHVRTLCVNGCVIREKGVYVSGRELRDFVASAGKDLE